MVSSALVDKRDPEFLEALRELPDQIQRVLDESGASALADVYVDAVAYFFIGREYTAPVALEGALKMKEITYKHAEGFTAGELKHGPLAMVTANTLVFAVLTEGSRLEKTLGNVTEV